MIRLCGISVGDDDVNVSTASTIAVLWPGTRATVGWLNVAVMVVGSPVVAHWNTEAGHWAASRVVRVAR